MVILDLPFKTRYRGLVKLIPAVSVCTPRIFRSSETPVAARGKRRAHSLHPNTLLFRAPGNTVSGLPRRRGPARGGETGGGSESRSRSSLPNRRGCARDKPALMQDAHADCPGYELFVGTKVVNQGTIQICGELRQLFQAHLP